MSKEIAKQRVFSRRAVFLGGAQAAAFSLLAGRLFYLQFLKSGEYTMLSENNRIKLQLVAPERGNILDCNGVPLAMNEKNFRLLVDYSGLTRDAFHAIIDKLNAIVPFGEKRLKELKAIHISPAALPEVLSDHLSWEQVSKIELGVVSMPGVFVDTGQIRHYPFAEHAAHLTGYVGTVSEDDVADDDSPILKIPEFKIGKLGVEQMLESDLRGQAGIRQLEVNVRGVAVREISKTQSVPGKDTRLTIDSRMQDFAANLVKNESASVVLMEVRTGNVLALVSMPGFDPDTFSKGIATDDWQKLSTNKRAPLLNKSISGLYPPGSTFKMMTGMAGLEKGAITTETAIHCSGSFAFGNHIFRCWKQGGHGTMHYHEAIQQSCDTFFYTVAQRLGGANAYADMARRFGLGETHDIGIIGEKGGNVPDPNWKWKHYKQKWTGGDTINCSIGQGYSLVSPLQLAVMGARIASGKEVEPRLFVPKGEENPVFDDIDIDTKLLDLTREAMTAVVNSPGGTALGSKIADPRYAMAGKTGTAQVKKLIREGMNQNSLPWEARHHALFVAFAPVGDPKYALGVIIEHGGGGAATAAPVAKEVMLKVQQLADEKLSS